MWQWPADCVLFLTQITFNHLAGAFTQSNLQLKNIKSQQYLQHCNAKFKAQEDLDMDFPE